MGNYHCSDIAADLEKQNLCKKRDLNYRDVDLEINGLDVMQIKNDSESPRYDSCS